MQVLHASKTREKAVALEKAGAKKAGKKADAKLTILYPK